MSIYSQANLAVRHVVSKDKRDVVLSGVYLDGDGSTVGTDGQVLMAVGPADREGVGFPGFEDEVDVVGDGVVVNADVVDQAVRNVPKGNAPLAAKHVIMTKLDARRVELTALDRTKEQRVSGRPGYAGYPKWKGILRDAHSRAHSSQSARVCVDRKALVRLLEAMDHACPDKANENAVFIEFGPNAETDGIMLRAMSYETGQHCIGYIKPLDTGGAWLKSDSWEKSVVGRSAKKRL